jgi:hypothetical protein
VPKKPLRHRCGVVIASGDAEMPVPGSEQKFPHSLGEVALVMLRLAEKRKCAGIDSRPVLRSSDPVKSRWVFRAAVFKSKACRGFVGYGDADPSNVSPLVHGAEMRVAETRAVNRALRKAYGIGICSVEEVGSFAEPVPSSRESKKLPPQPANGDKSNYGGPKVRDRLCQLIRQHQLDANLVKSYAVDFCGTKTLRASGVLMRNSRRGAS